MERKKRWARREAAGLGVLSLVVATFYSGICVYSAHILTSPSGRLSAVDPAELGGAEAWSAVTEDGLTLRGWYCRAGETRDLVVVVHGMHDNWGVVAGIAADLRERGHDVLVFDLRGHGASDPARLSMGRAERADIRAALAWAKGRGYEPARIAWLGQSMGAATVFYEALENPEITRLIMDSPYGDLPALLNEQLTLHSGLPRPFNPGILLAARLLFGVRTDDLVPIRLASRWDGRPLLVLHGGADFIVPVGQGRAIARAAGEGARLVVWERAGHIQIHRDDPEGYMGEVEGFLSGPAQPGEKATEARERSGEATIRRASKILLFYPIGHRPCPALLGRSILSPLSDPARKVASRRAVHFSISRGLRARAGTTPHHA